MKIHILIVLFLFGTGCTDLEPIAAEPTPDQGIDSGATGFLVDRGAPADPNADQVLDPNREGPAPTRVETRLQFPSTAAGEPNLVNCDVFAENGDIINDLQPVVYVEPDQEIMRNISGLTANRAGEYQVFCSLPAYNLVDESPELWTVTAGRPMAVETTITPEQLTAGTPFTVSCLAVDSFGNSTPAEGAGVFISPTGSFVFSPQPNQYEISRAGVFEVTCTLPGVYDDVVNVTVGPGTLSEVRANIEPQRAAYQIGELVEIRWSGLDAYGNEITSGLSISMDGGIAGEVVGESRIRFNQPGEQTITLTVSDGSSEVSTSLAIRIDAGAPSVECLEPSFGEQLRADLGSVVNLTGRISDDSAIVEVYADGTALSINSQGEFSIPVTAQFGPNVVKITAVDEIGGRTSRLCGFSAAGSHGDTQRPVENALRVRLDQNALDDMQDDGQLSSLGDALRAILNSDGLYDTLDEELSRNGGLVAPERSLACLPWYLGGFCFRGGFRYDRLSVVGPNTASLSWQDGGFGGTFAFEGVSIIGGLLGTVSMDIGFEVEEITGRIDVSLELSDSGQLKVRNVDASDFELINLRRIDLNDGGEGLIDRITDFASDLAQDAATAILNWFPNLIVPRIEGAIEEAALDVLGGEEGNGDGLLSSWGLGTFAGEIPLPGLDGTMGPTIEWQTKVDGLTIDQNAMIISTDAFLTTDNFVRRAPLGYPRAPEEVRVFNTSNGGTAAVLDFDIVNHALTELWENGYIDIDEDVISNLGGVDLLGADISLQLLAPPTVSGSQSGGLRIGIGPIEGRGAVPLISLDDVLFRAAGFVEAELELDGATGLRVVNPQVVDFKLSLDGVPIGTPGTSDFEDGLQGLLTDVLSTALENFLPVIPIPSFVMPDDFSDFGIPGGTRLGLISGDLDIEAGDAQFTGEFGELLP